jgi:FlaG/FlaF family flagellin (archaellin)
MPAAGVVLIVAVVIVVLALVYYLVATIVALRQITKGLDETIEAVVEIVEKTAPVEEVVGTINQHLDAAVDALEGLLVKKAGLDDAMGLIDGLYPGAAAQGLRNFPESTQVTPPRIGEVYTKGTLTLARLGREAPIAAASPNGPALRDIAYGSLAARQLYPEGRQARPEQMPRSPVIGTDAPVQYEPSEEPGIRRHMPTNGGTPHADPGAV